MRYDFDEIIDRRGTCSSKWDHGQDGAPQKEDCIPMWVADMDFACPPPVVEALEKVVSRRIYGYSGSPEDYYEKVCDFYKRRHGFEAKPEEIIFTQGVVSALNYAVEALSAPDDEIIVQPPVYYPFFGAASRGGRTVSENNLILHEDGSYTMDFDDLEKKAASEKAKMLILCSPHNPVGRVWTEEELRRVEDICVRNGVILLCDEIHNDLIRGGFTHVSVMNLFPDADNVICCTAPSKTFNIAGLGVSHMFCRNAEYREKIKAVVGRLAPSMFASAACLAAVTECDEWLDQLNEYLDGNFSLFYSLCGKYFPLAVPSRTEGTYLAWLDVRKYVGEETAELESRIYRECGVYIESGDAFRGKGFLRINLACPRSYIKEAFERVSLLLPRPSGSHVPTDGYLAEMFGLAKKTPSLKDSFLSRLTETALAELKKMSGSLELPSGCRGKLRSFFEEQFATAETYSALTRFYNTELNMIAAKAAFDSVTGK